MLPTRRDAAAKTAASTVDKPAQNANPDKRDKSAVNATPPKGGGKGYFVTAGLYCPGPGEETPAIKPDPKDQIRPEMVRQFRAANGWLREARA